MPLESLKPFRIPKKNTRQCHEGQKKVFLPIESWQQRDSSKTTHDAHLPAMHPQITELLFVSWLIFICTLVFCMLIFTLTIASNKDANQERLMQSAHIEGLPWWGEINLESKTCGE